MSPSTLAAIWVGLAVVTVLFALGRRMSRRRKAATEARLRLCDMALEIVPLLDQLAAEPDTPQADLGLEAHVRSIRIRIIARSARGEDQQQAQRAADALAEVSLSEPVTEEGSADLQRTNQSSVMRAAQAASDALRYFLPGDGMAGRRG